MSTRRSFLKFLGLAPAVAIAKPQAPSPGENFPKKLLPDLPPSPKVNAFQRAVAVSTVAPQAVPMYGTTTVLSLSLAQVLQAAQQRGRVVARFGETAKGSDEDGGGC